MINHPVAMEETHKNLVLFGVMLFLFGCSNRQQNSAAVSLVADAPALAPVRIAAQDDGRDAPPAFTNHRPATSQYAAGTLPTEAKQALLSAWRSPHSTSQGRVAALEKWLPRDVSPDLVKALIGDEGVLVHSFGSSVAFGSWTNGQVVGQSGYHDEWLLEYETPAGTISLTFVLKADVPVLAWQFEGARLVHVSKGP